MTVLVFHANGMASMKKTHQVEPEGAPWEDISQELAVMKNILVLEVKESKAYMEEVRVLCEVCPHVCHKL